MRTPSSCALCRPSASVTDGLRSPPLSPQERLFYASSGSRVGHFRDLTGDLQVAQVECGLFLGRGYPDLSDMQAHCPSRAAVKGGRHRRPRPGRLRAQRDNWASAERTHFTTVAFPSLAASCQDYPIFEDGVYSQNPATMPLSLALRYFQKSLFYYRVIAEMFGSIRFIDVC